MRWIMIGLSCALAGCTLITNPDRVRFEQGSGGGIDGGLDGGGTDGGTDGGNVDGGTDGGNVDGGGGAECGDGIVEGGEACDDGDVEDGDGCAAGCDRVEVGWVCAGQPSVCDPTCGNGTVEGAEDCDDGANDPGDGCSPDCRTEAGWVCSGSTCSAAACGDGIVAGDEVCDDRNDQECGTCNATCTGAGSGRCPPATGCVRGLDCTVGACDEGLCRFSCTAATCDAELPHCENGACSECDPATNAPCSGATPHCGGRGGVEFYCRECTQNTHCADPTAFCDLETGTCRGCEAFEECGGGGFECCGGRCVFASTDTSNCGACGAVCPAADACMNGSCCRLSGATCDTDSDCCPALICTGGGVCTPS